MSIQSEIDRITTAVSDAYAEAETKGATMPTTRNIGALAVAIASIPSGGNNFIEITIPAGRMRGDLNGDGFVDNEDYVILGDYITDPSANPLDEIQLLCADMNGDGRIVNADRTLLNRVVTGMYKLGRFANLDILGNWTNNPNYETEEGQAYVDIAVEGITENDDAIVMLHSGNHYFSTIEVHNGYLRIYASLLPIEEIKASVYKVEGEGNAVFYPLITKNVLRGELSKKEARSYFETVTVAPSDWVADVYPSKAKGHCTNFETKYPANFYDVEIFLFQPTEETIKAMSDAVFVGDVNNRLNYFGTMPTVSITFYVKVVKK